MGEQLEIYFYRHGYTRTNEEGRFGGRVDRVLSERGYEELKELREQYDYEEVEYVFSSPALRAQMTAALLFPMHTAEVLEGLWEYGFGSKENILVTDCLGTEEYQKFIHKAPDCTFDPEDGETMLEASFRIRAALTRIITKCRARGLHRIAVVSHGEILFHLMNTCLITEEPPVAFLLCPNGMGVHASVDMDRWFEEQKMDFVEFIPKGAPRLSPKDSPFYRDL